MLIGSAQGGQLEIVKLLLENSKERKIDIDFNVVNGHGDTPLHSACEMEELEIVKLLLDNSEERKLDIFKKNNDQETPMDIAMSWGCHEILTILHLEVLRRFFGTRRV